MTKPQEGLLLEKLRTLSPERVAEVEDFVDFLRLRDTEQTLTRAATQLAERSFHLIWNNPDDADYDDL